MEAEDKAKQLVIEYYNEMNPNAPDCNISYRQAKQCALICIDEIINSQALFSDEEAQLYDDLENTQYLSFWQLVKSELEKL